MTIEIYAALAVPILLLLIGFIREVKTTNGVSFILLVWALVPGVQVALAALILLYFLAVKAGGPLDRLYLWWKSNPYK